MRGERASHDEGKQDGRMEGGGERDEGAGATAPEPSGLYADTY